MTVIYIAGFRQHAGKTLTSLGIISQLKKFLKPEDIGYIKPVGQELFTLPNGQKIDKDAKIIEKFALPDIDMAEVSPVRLSGGVTKRFLKSEDPQQIIDEYEEAIHKAMLSMKDKKVIIAEGTGHPGVGGIVNLSNSRVSNLIGADVIYLAGGGIGKTLDMLEVDINYFQQMGVRVKGVVFNKVLPGKVDQMKEYVTEEYLTKRYSKDGSAIHVFGYLPEVDRLNKPSMELVSRKFSDAVLSGDRCGDFWKIPCYGVSIISKSYEDFYPEKHLKGGDIVLLSSSSRRRLKKIIEYNKNVSEEKRIVGIILTCMKESTCIDEGLEMLQNSGIPGIFVNEDTSSADEILYRCIKNTKLQSYDDVKNNKIEELFENHFDTEKLLKAFDIR